MRDVVRPAVAPAKADPGSPWLTMNRLNFLVPASDGNVYLVSGDGPAYAITPSAEIVGTIDLASPQPGASLIDVKTSGCRLAAIYTTRNERSSLRWISVYDLTTHKRVAEYGPVQDTVMCYRSEASQDRFSLLSVKDGRTTVLNASAR